MSQINKDQEKILKNLFQFIELNGELELFLNGSLEVKRQLLLKYLKEDIERTAKIQKLYATNPEFKQQFQNKVFNLLKDAA